jgi:NCS1 family nucleobase:cation symporter-1
MNQLKVKYSLSNWDLITVNPNYKTWNWKDLFCFWGVNIQSIIAFSLIASLYIVYDLNTFVVFFGTILGSFLVYIFSNLIGNHLRNSAYHLRCCCVLHWVLMELNI